MSRRTLAFAFGLCSTLSLAAVGAAIAQAAPTPATPDVQPAVLCQETYALCITAR